MVRLALEHAQPGEHQVLNLGTGEGVSMRDVVRTVEKVTELPVPVEYGPAAREAHTLVADTQRIRDVLGWAGRRSGRRSTRSWPMSGRRYRMA